MTVVLVPRDNVNDESVVILSVNFPSGAFVKKGDVVVSIETSKTNIDIEAPANGVIAHKLEKGSEIDVSSILFSVADEMQYKKENVGQSNIGDSNKSTNNANLRAKFSIIAMKRAEELGVNLKQFDHGWVTGADIERRAGVTTPYISIEQVAPVNPILKNTSSPILTVPYTKISFSKRKQAEAKNLLVGDHEATTSTIGMEIRLLGERLVPPPFLFKDSISDLIAFEAVKLLKQYPELNSSYIDEKTYAQYDEVNFGWSFDDGKNLKVLAIKNAEYLSLGKLQDEITLLLELYESGDAIPMELLTNSTVTFSDLSRSNASFMLPLINGKQTLILGVVRKSKYIFEIFASFDHRVSEGLSVVKFLESLKARILSYFMDKNGVANLFCYACGKSMAEELMQGHRGFIKMTFANGEDENFCRNCFEGW